MKWIRYGDHVVAPLRRSQTGSYIPIIALTIDRAERTGICTIVSDHLIEVNLLDVDPAPQWE